MTGSGVRIPLAAPAFSNTYRPSPSQSDSDRYDKRTFAPTRGADARDYCGDGFDGGFGSSAESTVDVTSFVTSSALQNHLLA